MPTGETFNVSVDVPDLCVALVTSCPKDSNVLISTHIHGVSVSSWKSGTVEDGHGGVYHVSVHEDYYPPYPMPLSTR